MTTLSLTSPKLRTVKLYGPMRRRFGREFTLNVSSPSEAIRALCAQVSGFKKYLMESKNAGLAFAVFIGKRNISEDGINDPVGSDEIRIAPIIQGSKRGGIFQVILGAVLVFAGSVLTLFGYGAVGVPLGQLGWSMVVGGVVQMLSPQPKGNGAKDRPENQPSYSMNGAVNTQAQGNPVPLAYGGPLIVGSALISGGVYAEDISTSEFINEGGGSIEA